jgi:hypothetical protein
MYATTNRCYNQRGFITNYVRSSISNCICSNKCQSKKGHFVLDGRFVLWTITVLPKITGNDAADPADHFQSTKHWPCLPNTSSCPPDHNHKTPQLADQSAPLAARSKRYTKRPSISPIPSVHSKTVMVLSLGQGSDSSVPSKGPLFPNFNNTVVGHLLIKGKAIPLQPLTGPEGSSRLRLPDFKTISTWRWQGCQPYAPAAFTPRKYLWNSFLLEAESTPGP